MTEISKEKSKQKKQEKPEPTQPRDCERAEVKVRKGGTKTAEKTKNKESVE